MKMRGLNGIRLYMGISYRARLGTISQVRARANTMIRAILMQSLDGMFCSLRV